jgi:hypothetical protein
MRSANSSPEGLQINLGMIWVEIGKKAMLMFSLFYTGARGQTDTQNKKKYEVRTEHGNEDTCGIGCSEN